MKKYIEMYYICQCLVSQGTIFILYILKILKINYDSNLMTMLFCFDELRENVNIARVENKKQQSLKK